MSQPSVSIIVPVFNEERHLPECLESVIKQTLDDIEIVVVNDCSTDNSQAIINDYSEKDSRIRLVSHDYNRGLGEARNTGFDSSSGKYIYFLDSDDSLPIDSIETLYSVANEIGSDLVLGGFNSKIDVDSSFVKCNLYNVSITNYPDLLYNHSALNKLISRSSLLESGIRFIPPRYAEDILFSLKLNLALSSISIITKKTYNYRWGRQIESATKEKVQDAQNNILTALKIVENYNNDLLFTRMQEKIAKNIFGNMARAVNALDSSELQRYLRNWNGTLSAISDSSHQGLPKHVSFFCRLISDEKYESAIKYWKRMYFLKSIRRALKLPSGIKKLFDILN